MLRGIAPGPRPAALFIALLIALGVVAAGPAGGASDNELVRVVVQLQDAPLAKYRDTLPGLKGVLAARTDDGHVDVKAQASRAYLAHIGKKHEQFKQRLDATAPGADVHWDYSVAFNGLTLMVPRSRIDELRQLPGVVAVTETYELEPELDESRNLIGLQQLWSSLPPSALGAGAGGAGGADRLGRERPASVLQPGRLQRAARLPEG